MSGPDGMLVDMAICQDCEQEMRTAVSCTVATLHVRGEPVPTVPYRAGGGGRTGDDARCGDCGVAPDGLHHLGCDLATCPRCGGQLLSCGCPFDELGWEEDDDGERADDLDGGSDPGGGPVGPDWATGLAAQNPCPRCGSTDVVPILYGFPIAATMQLAERGLVELGGCVIDGASPSSRCRACSHAWRLGVGR